ncbi:MAG: tagaturonate epimerase family protein [Christensenellaceae bacterium]|jgi:hypothetical protein
MEKCFGWSVDELKARVKEAFSDIGEISFYENSCAESGGSKFVMAEVDGQDKLLIYGKNSPSFAAFSGIEAGDFKLCDADHKNRLVLGQTFSYTKPRALGEKTATIGLGDRLGLANVAHLAAIDGSGMLPVLAQQSMRELVLTNRTYDDVLDAAAWSVFKYGWQNGFSADGDHLKLPEEIDIALKAGYTMITLDCSGVLKDVPEDAAAVQKAYEEIPADVRARFEKEYPADESAKALGLKFDMDTLKAVAAAYYATVDFIKGVYDRIKQEERAVDFEVSLDETTQTTLPEAHYFVANELHKLGVKIESMAPRFVGEFQKGIDYIGDTDDFNRDIKEHAAIAKHFGYKISVHSGSDKFRIFEYVSPAASGSFHLKTSGTSWLEAVRAIAQTEPALYRKMHACALRNMDRAREHYVVHADLGKVPALDTVSDADLPDYLTKDDSRQLMHITYGYILDDPELKKEVYAALKKHKKEYEAALKKHIGRHVSLLMDGK